MTSRRELLKHVAVASGGAALSATRFQSDVTSAIVIDPKPTFQISPYLYMQFMEPLGITDSSVEASWDYGADNWRKDFVDCVRNLAPDVVRFGGDFSRYYKWREGVGPVASRPWMRNHSWGGKETNRVGTNEFVSFCKQVGAQPLYSVNFESDGIESFQGTPEGNRSGTASEAAEWVSYANDPDHRERKAHGFPEPYDIKLWQIGNETSYVKDAFPKEEAIAHTITFAREMRKRDSSIQLIGWGDRGRQYKELWAADLLREAGEHLNYVAIHMMGQSPKRPDTLLLGQRYEQDPARAWQELLELSNRVEERISELEQVITSQNSPAGIAVTEGHLSLRPHNTNPILCEWLSAVYHARSLNIYQRHGAHVKIATAADFNGTRWTVMAVRLPVPRGAAFLMPVASIARLFKHHNGDHAVTVTSAPPSLDIAAARNGNKLFLHVLNLEFAKSVEVNFAVSGGAIAGGRVFEIAPENLRTSVSEDQPEIFAPKERELPVSSTLKWRFPAGSVSAVELDLREGAV